MILYFIDGKVDCFETSISYPDLENSYNIDAADGVTSCFDQLNELDMKNNHADNLVIVSNFLPFLDQTDDVYIYDSINKTFKKWNFNDYSFPDKSSKVETYIYLTYTSKRRK